jgi:UDP-glucose:(heptosyl)LPS alpha-1,3-glucosyltransferase
LESVDRPTYRFYLRMLRFMGASDAALMRAERDQYVDPSVQRFLAIAPMVRDDMLRWHGVDPMRVQVLMNGVDLNVFQPPTTAAREAIRAKFGVAPGRRIGLMVSHNHRLKGLGPVLRALGALRTYRPDLDTELWVVGKGRTFEYRAIAALSNYAGRVRFWGAQEDMAPFYQAADTLLAPSFYDAASLVVLEGMATGLPVLTTRQNGSSAVVSSWEEGFVLDSPTDRAAMLEGLTHVFDPRARQTMGVAARKRAAQFPVEANFAAVERIYAECREERGGEPASASAEPAARPLPING